MGKVPIGPVGSKEESSIALHRALGLSRHSKVTTVLFVTLVLALLTVLFKMASRVNTVIVIKLN